MTEQQNNMVAPILTTIVNEDIRKFAEVLVDGLPQYIWEVGASSTGKYHPAYSLGVGGLMRHQIAVVRFLNYFFELEQYNTNFTSREMDLMRVAGLVHDGRKSGEQTDYNRSKFTKFDHPIQMANVIRSYNGKYLNPDEIEFIASTIESHMGQWNTDYDGNELLLSDVLGTENGLSHIRNIGTKSIKEIKQFFFEECYTRLLPYEKAQYWQEVLDSTHSL